MSGPFPAPPTSRKSRWLVVAFILALVGFTFLCWRDASRPPVRPAAGGTFTGRDVDGRLVYVNLFALESGWQGWLYRDGKEQAAWFFTTNRAHRWQATFNEREHEEFLTTAEPILASAVASTVASTADVAKLNATFPRQAGATRETVSLTRQFEHLSYRRLAGVRLGRVGGTKEYLAQFPRLTEAGPFTAAVNREILRQCEEDAAEFTSEPFEFWKTMIQIRGLPGFNQHELTANWQLRLLTTNLASFSVWSYDATGGNGNHSHWRGANFLWEAGYLRIIPLDELFRTNLEWQAELRTRCVPKLKMIGAPKPEAVLEQDVTLEVFTLSPTGLQIYFNPYAIASGADGEFVVHFGYGELKDLLRTNGPAALLPTSRN